MGLHSGGLEARATDFGCGCALIGGLHCEGLHFWGLHCEGLHFGGLPSEWLHFGGLESPATDIGSGHALTGGLHSRGLHFGDLHHVRLHPGAQSLEPPISDLAITSPGVYTLGCHTFGLYVLRDTLLGF